MRQLGDVLGSDGKTFPARAVSNGVWVGDLKAAFLQVFAVIEHRTADEKSALWIDKEPDILRWHEDVALFRAIHQVHNVLQAGAASTDHLETQRALWFAFLFKQRG